MSILALLNPKNNPEGVIMVCPPLLSSQLCPGSPQLCCLSMTGWLCSLPASVGIHGLAHHPTQLKGRQGDSSDIETQMGSKSIFMVELYTVDSNS